MNPDGGCDLAPAVGGDGNHGTDIRCCRLGMNCRGQHTDAQNQEKNAADAAHGSFPSCQNKLLDILAYAQGKSNISTGKLKIKFT